MAKINYIQKAKDLLNNFTANAGNNLKAWGQVATQPQLRQDYSNYVVKPAVQNTAQAIKQYATTPGPKYSDFSNLGPVRQPFAFASAKGMFGPLPQVARQVTQAFPKTTLPVSHYFAGSSLLPVEDIALGQRLPEKEKYANARLAGAATAALITGGPKLLLKSAFTGAGLGTALQVGKNIYNKEPILKDVGKSAIESGKYGVQTAQTMQFTNSLVNSLSKFVPFLKPLTERGIENTLPGVKMTLNQAFKKIGTTLFKRVVKAALIETPIEGITYGISQREEGQKLIDSIANQTVQNFVFNVGSAGVTTLWDSRVVAPILKKSVDQAIDQYKALPLEVRSGGGGDINAKIGVSPTTKTPIGESGGVITPPQGAGGEGVKTEIAPRTQLDQNIPTGKGLLSQTTTGEVSQGVSVQKKNTLPNQIDSRTTLENASSVSILPQKGKLNVEKLNLPEEGQKIVRASDQGTATIIGNKEVIEAAKLTKGSKRPITDAQMQGLMAKRLNSRQAVVTLTKEFDALKKSGADESTLIKNFNEISDQSRSAQQDGTFAGRVLQAQKIIADELATPQQKILALLDNAGVDKAKYSKDAINVDWKNPKQVIEFYRKYVPPKLGELLTEFRYTNMLSSPLTHIINTATNIFQSGVIAPIEKTISGQLDWVKSKVTGSERQYYASDGIKYVQGYYKALPEAWSKFKNVLTGKEISFKPDMERIPVSTKGIYKAYTTPLRALEAADQLFMTLVKGGETASLQGRGLAKEAIETMADNSARYRLFRQAFDPEGKTGQGYLLKTWDKYNSLINQLRRLPGGNWIVPFLQTPTNILKQGVEYSPLGIATLPGSKFKTQQLSKAIIGTTVFMGAYGLLNSTEFTWDVPSGQKERDLFYAANMQPYSVKIGDKWVSYSKLGPLSYPIAMAAALRYAEKYNLPTDKESAISTAVGGMLKFFSDQSYVKQLGDFIDSVQTGKGIIGGLKMQAANSISQLIPYKSFLGWMSRMIDPVSRKSTGVVSSITSQLPVLSKTVEPYYNPITGKPSERTDRFANAVSPIRMSTGDKGIENMYKYTASGKRAYMNLKALPPEQAASIFAKINKSNPAIAREIVKIKNEVELGATNEEKSLLNQSVPDGERAFTIARQFQKLKTPEEKAALWKKYVSLKIITTDVAKQLIEMKNRGEF